MQSCYISSHRAQRRASPPPQEVPERLKWDGMRGLPAWDSRHTASREAIWFPPQYVAWTPHCRGVGQGSVLIRDLLSAWRKEEACERRRERGWGRASGKWMCQRLTRVSRGCQDTESDLRLVLEMDPEFSFQAARWMCGCAPSCMNKCVCERTRGERNYPFIRNKSHTQSLNWKVWISSFSFWKWKPSWRTNLGSTELQASTEHMVHARNGTVCACVSSSYAFLDVCECWLASAGISTCVFSFRAFICTFCLCEWADCRSVGTAHLWSQADVVDSHIISPSSGFHLRSPTLPRAGRAASPDWAQVSFSISLCLNPFISILSILPFCLPGKN